MNKKINPIKEALSYIIPKWSFWLSVDPLAEDYPGWSPYNYTLLNPVKLVDPDGRSVDWEPTKNGDLVAENGDNAKSLSEQLGVSEEEAQEMIASQGLKNTAGGKFSKYDYVDEGQTLELDNNATRAIKKSDGLTWKKYLETRPYSKKYVKNIDYYNCDDCAQMAVFGEEISVENATKYRQFPNFGSPNPTKGFEQVNNLDGVPINGGIITIGSDHTVSSYGQSRNGTQYVLNKGGYDFKPVVEPLKTTIKHFNENMRTNYNMSDVRYYKKTK